MGSRRELDAYGGPQHDLIAALASRKRRQILRVLHKEQEARSPAELAKALDIPVGIVSYHFRVLASCSALTLAGTRPVRGAIEHFYVSNVKPNQLVNVTLDLTHKEDEER